MNCIGGCGRIVERSIEGECICEDCWTWRQMNEEERQWYLERKWFDTHCSNCEKEIDPKVLEKHNGYCKKCDEEMKEETL